MTSRQSSPQSIARGQQVERTASQASPDSHRPPDLMSQVESTLADHAGYALSVSSGAARSPSGRTVDRSSVTVRPIPLSFRARKSPVRHVTQGSGSIVLRPIRIRRPRQASIRQVLDSEDFPASTPHTTHAERGQCGPQSEHGHLPSQGVTHPTSNRPESAGCVALARDRRPTRTGQPMLPATGSHA
jgi:hypothetical protein